MPWYRKGEITEMNFEEYGKTGIISLIDEWTLGRNAERDRAIMKRRLIDGRTYEQLADEFGMSSRHVATIVRNRTDQLAEKMPPG